ncbi:pyrrolysine--tRNA(Pyl) ligase small subunit [Desulfosporosinus sp. BICA1-9]|uniref:pyrrolysine--tRNA(Pyl) ligase small subunit n=1 Tax=Desulfosporosinus sp. BICA1-9 TaxID=1531958 RepID=UPI000AFE659F|nr:pyrrolysine--tRNA(Pyl) ligase small subunit [Desulfosporosinus sp. BICA1-9]HBW37627.1 hypothetical protein [Desulfosporosinus sp.]
MSVDSSKKRYYRKNVDFFKFVEKLKLWPSKSGTLHGIKSMTIRGNRAEIITHCNESFMIYNSKNSRAARCLRNKLFFRACGTCKIPNWKLVKYSATFVNQNYGSRL